MVHSKLIIRSVHDTRRQDRNWTTGRLTRRLRQLEYEKRKKSKKPNNNNMENLGKNKEEEAVKNIQQRLSVAEKSQKNSCYQGGR